MPNLDSPPINFIQPGMVSACCNAPLEADQYPITRNWFHACSKCFAITTPKVESFIEVSDARLQEMGRQLSFEEGHPVGTWEGDLLLVIQELQRGRRARSEGYPNGVRESRSKRKETSYGEVLSSKRRSN